MSSRSLARRLVGIPWPPLLAVALILCLAVTFVVQRTIGTREQQSADQLSIFVSGDTQGMLSQCAASQFGGLARRGEMVRKAKAAAQVLYADLGNAPGGDSPYDRLKFGAILRGEKAMGVIAHNLGPGELRLGAEELHRLAAELKFPFVSTNVRDLQGRPLAEPMRLVETAGRRIAVVGLVSPRYADESLNVLAPATALAQALADQAPRYDTLLVLAYLPGEELMDLAMRLPKKAVLVGPSGAAVGRRDAGNLAGAVGTEGRSLVHISFATESREQWTADEMTIAADLPDDPKQVENLVAYHQALAKHDFSPQMTDFSMPLPPEVASAQRIAGTHTCRACHLQESAVWDNSTHARAWQSLVDRGVHYDAACQRCHTTAYGWEGGFQSAERSIGTVSVGCESCHGPALAHVLDPNIHTPLVASQQCVQCHRDDNSPGFDYATAWTRILHGVRPTGPSTPAIPLRGSIDLPAGEVN